jgi:hypothetical protein
VALYAGGALTASIVAYAFSLTDAWLPDDWTVWQAAGLFVATMAALGVTRWAIPRARPVMDGLCALCVLAPIIAGLAF